MTYPLLKDEPVAHKAESKVQILSFPNKKNKSTRIVWGLDDATKSESLYDQIKEKDQNLEYIIRNELRDSFAEEFAEVKHIAALNTMQKYRIISLLISSILAGAAFSLFIVAFILQNLVSPFFFLSIGLSFSGVSIACLLALLEGHRYDE